MISFINAMTETFAALLRFLRKYIKIRPSEDIFNMLLTRNWINNPSMLSHDLRYLRNMGWRFQTDIKCSMAGFNILWFFIVEGKIPQASQQGSDIPSDIPSDI